ncbi:MAG: bifunctional (p)ppGpp synthetase/guanosine-3',5'-bis(diphosphate) 3'-pyrophosphohydrolase, partial [Bdellovibrionales bacterium]|nr:bifunctional (p)ppGpp synthetase/guanosine-3',5'-bis(diphosphate) 3'-pyrophosphohydrolase [Bdellovibrionales bacterium]
EDLSFRYAYPESYYALAQKVAKKKRERERYIEEVKKLLVSEFSKRTRVKYEVTGRSKHIYSIYRKMQERNIDYEQVYDILAFRVCVNSIPECYEVLGLVHSIWKPIPGRFKDFIAMPKANKYQSLHTTVIGPGGERIEIQIRTHEMHLVAEKGIAAHWQYKEESRGSEEVSDEVAEKFNWLRELVNLHQQTHNSDEFLESVKTDLFDSEIYVFTPKGDVKELPEGATPIDFAYSVHTDVGHRIVAARVNGRLVSLKYQLKNGDSVEVITSKSQTPSKDWLKFCVTTRAKSKIRAHVKTEQRKRAAEIGHQLLEKTFRRHGSSYVKHAQGVEFEKLLKENGANNLEDLLIRVGYGKLMPSHVFERLVPNTAESLAATEKEEESSFLAKAFKSAVDKRKKSSSPIRVDGMEDLLVRFGKCCTPIPGDSIVGFITRGRGITIHRSDCSKAFELDHARRIDVEWNSSKGKEEGRLVRVRVVSQDIPGLLKNMTEIFSVAGVNIHNAQARTTKDRKAICVFDLSVRNIEQLSLVMSSLMKLKGIIGVTRITHS